MFGACSSLVIDTIDIAQERLKGNEEVVCVEFSDMSALDRSGDSLPVKANLVLESVDDDTEGGDLRPDEVRLSLYVTPKSDTGTQTQVVPLAYFKNRRSEEKCSVALLDEGLIRTQWLRGIISIKEDENTILSISSIDGMKPL